MSRSFQAMIEAQNTANEYANELAPQVAEDFRSVLGVQILDESGTLLPEFYSLFATLHDTRALHVYPSIDGEPRDKLVLVIAVRQEIKGRKNSCVHHVVIAVIGTIQDGVLVDLPPIEPRRTDYTVESLKAPSLIS